MENLDVRTILPMLRQFGISPEMLGPEKVEDLMKLADKIGNPSDITPEMSRKILDILGVSTRGVCTPKQKDNEKIPRNSPCPCGRFGKKYKKCCGDQTTPPKLIEDSSLQQK